jgi:hypothetical protein
MKINFTKKEYQTLLNILYIADWVLHAHSEEKTEEKSEYRELKQKILSLADEFGMKSCLEHNEKTNEKFFSKEFIKKNEIEKHIDGFENATFWEELLERMARRDFVREYGEEAILKMPISERFEKEILFHKKYDEEFRKNGLKSLKIE